MQVSGGAIADGSVTGAKLAAAVKSALVKGWIRFNGTGTIAINDSFNVASIVDNGVGIYTINWDTDFSSADYAIGGTTGRDATTSYALYTRQSVEPTAGATNIETKATTNNALGDAERVYVNVMGEQ